MINDLIERYPALAGCKNDIRKAVDAIEETYVRGGKLLLCGNGGSCADCEHISGELMKGFLKKRPLNESKKLEMKRNFCGIDDAMLDKLQGALPAISLGSATALNSAFSNDVDPELVYAQALLGLGCPNDILIAISTSGNSKNALAAAKLAKALKITVISLTGMGGGKLKEVSDVCVAVAESETYKVQELHLPVYHWLCAKVEEHFFKN